MTQTSITFFMVYSTVKAFVKSLIPTFMLIHRKKKNVFSILRANKIGFCKPIKQKEHFFKGQATIVPKQQ